MGSGAGESLARAHVCGDNKCGVVSMVHNFTYCLLIHAGLFCGADGKEYRLFRREKTLKDESVGEKREGR